VAFEGMIKKQSIRQFPDLIPAQTSISHSLQRFSTDKAKLPPNSVGASVDNVFAIRYRP
jgi:hypothetical protein